MGGWVGFVKLEKKIRISDILVQDIMEFGLFCREVDWYGMGFGIGAWRHVVSVGTEEGVSSPVAVYQVFVTYAATTFGQWTRPWYLLLKDGSFWFCYSALGCSPWVGLLLRWSHSCLYVECLYLVPHLSFHP